MVRIREHAHDLLLDFVRRIGQVNAVSEGLAHLGFAVYAGKPALELVFGDHSFRQNERLAVYLVELFNYLSCLFEHGELILADRHNGSVKRGDVGSLGNGVGEKSRGESFLRKTSHLYLSLDGGISRKSRSGNEVHIIECQGVQSGQCRLYADSGPGGVNACRKVVKHDIYDVFAYLSGIVGVVGERLVIRDKDVYFIELAGVLELDPSFQRADIVSEVKPPRGTVAGEYNVLFSHSDSFLPNLSEFISVSYLYIVFATFARISTPRSICSSVGVE